MSTAGRETPIHHVLQDDRTSAATPVNVWRERAVYALLFMLPVAGISVRHWFSATFLLLALLALPELRRWPSDLARSERILLAILGGFFVLFVLTAAANGWRAEQTEFIGREIRFLAAVPIYLLLRRLPDAGLWLVRGGVVGGFTLLGQALYDIYVLQLPRAQGIYSPNLLGPFAAYVCVFLLVLWRIDRAWRPVLLASMAAAVAALALSTSRGGYLGFMAMLLVWAGVRFRGWRLGTAAAAIVVLAALAYGGSEHVRRGVDMAAEQLREVVEAEPLNEAEMRTSVPARLEMWRVSLMIFRDHPLLGVGRGNYTEAARVYVAQGRVHPVVVEHSHPHSAYLEALVSKGIFGLVNFLAMLIFPLYVFIRGHRNSPETALLGMLHVTGFALFSLTDASTIIKGNYIAIWLIYLTAFFAWHTRAQSACRK